MNELLNFSHEFLNLMHNKIHNRIEGMALDNFIHELQNYLELQESNKILEHLPTGTNLHLAKFENDYAVCFDYKSKLIYNIPKSCIKGNIPEIGEPIKCISFKKFCIDYTGISVNENDIEYLLNECSYATLPSRLNILPEYYKISEIGEDFAICKNLNTNNPENIPIDDIPKKAKVGDTLIYKKGNFTIKKI